MLADTIEKYESNVRSYCRKFPAVFDKAKGPYIWDEDGKQYVDFFCGASSLNYGHNNDYIKKAILDYVMDDHISHALDMTTKAKIEFIEALEKRIIQPRNLEYKILFPGPTGTNAVEAAMKIARKATGRQSVWAFMGAFHGMTQGALSLTSDSFSRGGAGVALGNTVHVPAPYMFPDFDLIEGMRRVLKDDHSALEVPAAIIVETTQAEGGVQVFSNKFLMGLRVLCDEFGILLIIDDIQVGCWRAGSFFSFERAGIAPDIVTMSKSLGGYGYPFAVALVKPEYDCLCPGEHNGTFRGNQLAMVAAKSGLEYALANDIETQVQKKQLLMSDRLNAMASRFGLEARGIGMLWALEFEDGSTVKRLIGECFSQGLIAESCGRGDNALKIMPPLNIDEDVLEKGLSIIEASIDTVLREEE